MHYTKCVCDPDLRSIRLVGSGGDCAGRLEVFHSGSWGTVCDDSWDIEDAQVVCRQLQCGVALSTHIPAWFGPGTGSIWLNEVECEGNETSLWNCRFQLCEEGDCGHQEDVGVVCSGTVNAFALSGDHEFESQRWPGVQESKIGLALRVGGSVLVDVSLCCSELCDWSCYSALVCFLMCDVCDVEHWSLRLSGVEGSCSGRLEVYHNATWGSVCDDQWNISNARVVCRQLGCGSALSADRNVSSGPGEGTIWLNRVKCRGDEIHLWDCHHSLKNHTDCSPAGVTCADISLKAQTLNCNTLISRS
ncbi:scavenger receptor cysteine-rich type 1 protein M130-like [Ictalurus furcatus]|uniref:scavenger receptor cysteine-rich type 1 protein M130-like n=1 Tax=Ictalurus furcatus TaxID=66913 RepID=UPI00234FD309|nr:scavenger receptor cysteine-rich type 1 protein M130-like [Ictalurus furcatus]